MAALSTIAIAGGAALAAGGVAAGLSDEVSTSKSGIILDPQSDLESLALGQQQRAFGDINRFVGAGPGLTDVQQSLQAQRGLAEQLRLLSESGGVDTARGQQVAQNLLAPQQVAIQQQFRGASEQAQQLAARLGRPVNDPILQARLFREQSERQERLGAQETALAQQLAFQLPERQLGFASQRSQVLGGLASQALQNRQAILGLGSNLVSQERNFRLQTGLRFGEQVNEGSVGAGIAGGLSGFGQGLALGAGGGIPGGGVQSAPSGFGSVISQQAAAVPLPSQQTIPFGGSQFGGGRTFSLRG